MDGIGSFSFAMEIILPLKLVCGRRGGWALED
jgi:hypothetical protein